MKNKKTSKTRQKFHFRMELNKNASSNMLLDHCYAILLLL